MSGTIKHPLGRSVGGEHHRAEPIGIIRIGERIRACTGERLQGLSRTRLTGILGPIDLAGVLDQVPGGIKDTPVRHRGIPGVILHPRDRRSRLRGCTRAVLSS